MQLPRRGVTAQAQNGHTVLIDRPLMEQTGPMPFVARTIESKWVVTASQSPDLTPGDVIEKINGIQFEQFYSEVRPYISASSEYGARNMLFSQLGDFVPLGPLIPEKFDLMPSGSRTVTIDRHAPPKSQPMKTDGHWLEQGKPAYIPIFYPDNEKRALELVREFQQAPALIINVRGNAGGSTPSDLTASLRIVLIASGPNPHPSICRISDFARFRETGTTARSGSRKCSGKILPPRLPKTHSRVR